VPDHAAVLVDGRRAVKAGQGREKATAVEEFFVGPLGGSRGLRYISVAMIFTERI
jgi:hypothetical protein